MERQTGVIEERGEGEEETPQAPTGPDWLALANSAFDGSTSYLDTNYRLQWEKNLRQWRSQHPQDSKYLSDTWKGKSKFFRPKTRAAERKSEALCAAAYFSTADVVDISAQNDNDPRKQASALFWKAAIDHRLTKSVPWFMTTMGAYQDTQVMGAVVSHQTWDFECDRPDVELRPLENIRLDPGARWPDAINTSPYLIDLLPMYAFEVKEKQGWNKVTDGQLKGATSATFDSTRAARQGNRTDPQETATPIDDFTIVWVRRVIMRRGGQDILYYTLGHEALLTEPVPLRQAYPWLPKKGRKRPYVMGICVIETHKNYPSAPVELQGPVQSEINEIVNQRRDNVRLVLDKRYHVKRHKQVDIRSLTRNTPGSVTMMDEPGVDVIPQEWKDVTGSAYQEEDRLNLDHDDLSGTFSGSSVASNRKLNETVGGMNLLSTSQNSMGDYTLKTFTETWYEPVLQQVLWLEQMYETDEVLIALAGEKAQLVEKFGIDTVTDELLMESLTLTINVGMGATNPINSLERFVSGLERLAKVYGPEMVAQRTDFDAVSAEVFGKLGYKDGRRFMLNQDDPRVAGLTQKIAELQAKIAQKRSPEVDAAQAAKMRAETMKIVGETFYGAIQGAELIAAIPEIAAVADKIIEACGYVPPSPPGVDPNIPTAPSAPSANVVPMRRNTSPLQPAIPASASAGVTAGIEGGA